MIERVIEVLPAFDLFAGEVPTVSPVRVEQLTLFLRILLGWCEAGAPIRPVDGFDFRGQHFFNR